MHSFEEHCQKSAFQGQFEHKPLSAEGYSQQSPPLILYLFGLQLFCALVIDVAAWTNPHVIGLFFFFLRRPGQPQAGSSIQLLSPCLYVMLSGSVSKNGWPRLFVLPKRTLVFAESSGP